MKILQFGRSMIEMLGVLAIIGVLSIGGIAGYRIAMNKYQANVILEDVNRFAFTIIERSPLPDGEISRSDFVQTTPYTLTATNDVEGDYFYIDVHDVPKGVCHELLNKKSNDFEIYAGEEGMDLYQGEDDICSGVNLMAFLFDMGSDFCRKDSDCGECGKCNNNKCLYGYKQQSGTCRSCGQKTFAYVDREECHKCKNMIWRPIGTGQCFNPLSLDRDYYANVERDDCVKNPNHYYTDWYFCFYCSGTFDRTMGVCSTAKCTTTPNGRLYGLDKNTCEQCGGTYGTSYLDGGGIAAYCDVEPRPWSAID